MEFYYVNPWCKKVDLLILLYPLYVGHVGFGDGGGVVVVVFVVVIVVVLVALVVVVVVGVDAVVVVIVVILIVSVVVVVEVVVEAFLLDIIRKKGVKKTNELILKSSYKIGNNTWVLRLFLFRILVIVPDDEGVLFLTMMN